MGVTIVRQKLRIATIQKTDISKFSHALIKLIFLEQREHSPHRQEKQKFISFTETKDDYTLVLDEQSFSQIFQRWSAAGDSSLTTLDSCWFALHVSVDAFESHTTTVAGIAKLADSLIIPLADHDISIFMISSYQTDYILVKECDVMRVVNCLKVFYNVYQEEDDDTTPLFLHDTVNNAPQVEYLSSTDPPTENFLRPVVHELSTPANKFFIATMTKEMFEKNSLLLIDIMFYSAHRPAPQETCEEFFSFSLVKCEVSLVLDEAMLKRFTPDSILPDNDALRMIRIGNPPLGFDECGIVAQISQPIAQANVSEYYISSFFFDHALIPEKSSSKVIEILKSRQQVMQKNDTKVTNCET